MIKRLIIVLQIMMFVLCGCGRNVDIAHDTEGFTQTAPIDTASNSAAATKNAEDDAELWIVMDFQNEALIDIVSDIVDDFLLEHNGVTAKLETVPGTAEERDARIAQLRVQIMAGKGPDLYLLHTPRSSDSLFLDISMAMNNDVFLDISQYYDADTELEKERLQPQIMDAGVVGGSRYVLPLRFQFPTAYVNVELLASAGLNAQDIGTGLNGMVESAEILKSQTLVAEVGFFEENFLSLFTEAIDYERQTVTLDQEELEKFLTQYRSLTAEMETDILYTTVAFNNYTSENEFWAKPGLQLVYDRDINMQWVEEPYAVEFSNLNDLVENLRIAKAEEIELAVVPVTASNGSLTATVTYCGAISANCEYPELAYEILRELLLEENQWNSSMSAASDGWPVLIEGSWDKLNKDLFAEEVSAGVYADAEKNKRRRVLKFVELTEDDFSVLNTQIDTVRFPYSREADLMELIDSQLNLAKNPDAMCVDVADLAEEILWELELHLAEG